MGHISHEEAVPTPGWSNEWGGMCAMAPGTRPQGSYLHR